MSWESTATYYRRLNELTRDALGGLHSAQLLLWSFDFAEIEMQQASGDWAGATAQMVRAARRLESGGAACVLICTNTMHKMALEVQDAISIPVLHIADATGAALQAAGCQRPLLLATAYTMEQDFYRGRLRNACGIDALVPEAAERKVVHNVIYDELCRGIVSATSRQRYVEVIERARNAGADSVIFGCTEVGLLLQADDCLGLPVFDTTELHARTAIEFALA